MSNPLDPENDWKNKIADQNGIFYVEEEISIDDVLKQF